MDITATAPRQVRSLSTPLLTAQTGTSLQEEFRDLIVRLELQPLLDPELFASAEALFCDNIEVSRGRRYFGVPIAQPTDSSSSSSSSSSTTTTTTTKGSVAGAFGYVRPGPVIFVHLYRYEAGSWHRSLF